MKFLGDQDVYALTLRVLVGLGHDVLTVAELGLSQADDEFLLRTAAEQRRILVTRDRDYGNLVFVKGLNAGILYLRMLPSNQEAVHEELQRVLMEHSEEELLSSFVVVESDRHRIRKLPKPS